MIKGYTDINQSKKLAEILPLESADMRYLSEESLIPKVIYNGMVFFNSEEEKPATIIPCWSLAALLSVLPEPYQLTSNKEGKAQLMLIHQLEKDYYDNPIDACVAMIVKLHELNLL